MSKVRSSPPVVPAVFENVVWEPLIQGGREGEAGLAAGLDVHIVPI